MDSRMLIQMLLIGEGRTTEQVINAIKNQQTHIAVQTSSGLRHNSH